MRAPAGFHDIRFLEQTFSSAQKMGDLFFLSNYFIHRTAEILALSNRDPEALLLYEYINHVLRTSDPARDISDLKYAVAVYKKQLLISTSPYLKIYISISEQLNLFKSFNLGRELLTGSDLRVELLRELKNEGLIEESMTRQQKLLSRTEFFKVRSLVMMNLAFMAYEVNPAEAAKWIEQAKKSDPPTSVQFALTYLEGRIQKKKSVSSQSDFKNEFEERLLKSLRLGLFNAVKEELKNEQGQAFGSARVRETESWLDMDWKSAEKEKPPFFSVYFKTLHEFGDNPVEAADKLAAMAADRDWSLYSSFLRYQAWGVAFFDAKDFSRAVLFKDFLKTYDPFSLFSQLESMGGTFKFAFKEFKGEELARVWEHMPQLFDKQRSEEWEGFKSRKKRVAQTIVYEGQVYVVNYDVSGLAQKVLLVGMNQVASERKPVVSEKLESEKLSLVDKFFYEYMIQFIPEGVNAFKDQIAKLSERLKEPVFTRFYTEFEFQEYIVRHMEKRLGGVAKGIQAKIDEQGFALYAIFDLKLLTAPVSGVGKLITEDESGRLILKLDHVKVNGIYLPDWILRRVEKNFSLTANLDYTNSASGIEILNMEYQPGGVQIKCRKSSINLYGNAAMAA